jgi:ribosomal protein L11 methyltransferase
LAPALIELAPELVRLSAPGGTLIVSGVLTTRHDHVVAALAPLVVVDRLEHDGWCALVMRR